MKRIGLLSDTHAWWDDRYIRYFESCDEIWHAGDIGSLEVARRLEAIKPLRAVYGNIDGQELRTIYPKNQRFTIEGADVWITHIGGYPGKYDTAVVPEIFRNPPDLFVSGHSHILKVMYDKSYSYYTSIPELPASMDFINSGHWFVFLSRRVDSKTSK